MEGLVFSGIFVLSEDAIPLQSCRAVVERADEGGGSLVQYGRVTDWISVGPSAWKKARGNLLHARPTKVTPLSQIFFTPNKLVVLELGTNMNAETPNHHDVPPSRRRPKPTLSCTLCRRRK
jgi:hypothetical protein